MASISDSDISYIISGVKSAIKNSMSTMEKEIKDTHQLCVYKYVYDAYSPKSGYVRRMDKGGLSSQSNFKTTVTEKRNIYELTLENTTVGSGNGRPRLDSIITNASGYKWRSVPKRPFIDKTATEFKKEVNSILSKSLSSQGFTVK